MLLGYVRPIKEIQVEFKNEIVGWTDNNSVFRGYCKVVWSPAEKSYLKAVHCGLMHVHSQSPYVTNDD